MIAECDEKLARYRAALEAGTDPALVAGWTREVTLKRSAALAQLTQGGDASDAQRMSREQIAVLREAHPADKSEVYQRLGLRLDYQPGDRKVRVEAHLNPHPIGKRYVSGGGRTPNANALVLPGELWLAV